jgi:hypothetical protein
MLVLRHPSFRSKIPLDLGKQLPYKPASKYRNGLFVRNKITKLILLVVPRRTAGGG